jgi:hypothetical protein
MRLIFAANVLVAGWIALTSMLSPQLAARTVFSGAYTSHEVMRLIGCLWLAIALLSIGGLFRPQAFAMVLLVQLLYKGTWLVAVALPAWQKGQPYPVSMTLFFIIWVTVLPFFIPWKTILTG